MMLPSWEEFLRDLTPTGNTDYQHLEESRQFGRDWFTVDVASSWTSWTAANWQIPITAVTVYVVVLVLVHSYMKTRETAIKLPNTVMFWNFALAIYSFAGALVTIPALLFGFKNGLVNGFYPSVCSDAYYYGMGYPGFFVMLFIYSKFIELVDTLWIVLRKAPLTPLHVWHHITVLLYCWHSYAAQIGTGLWFAAMNYLVHSVMYCYFGATQISPSWRKAVKPFAILITLLQLAQMCVGIAVTVASMVYTSRDDECHVNNTNSLLGLVMYTSYFLLFMQFFIRGYCSKATPKLKTK